MKRYQPGYTVSRASRKAFRHRVEDRVIAVLLAATGLLLFLAVIKEFVK